MRKVPAGIFLGIFLAAFAGPLLAADEPPKKAPAAQGVTHDGPGQAAFTKAPDFVPFVVDQQQYTAVMGYLNGLTFKDAAPLVKWLNENEERAKGQWEADNRPKVSEAPK